MPYNLNRRMIVGCSLSSKGAGPKSIDDNMLSPLQCQKDNCVFPRDSTESRHRSCPLPTLLQSLAPYGTQGITECQEPSESIPKTGYAPRDFSVWTGLCQRPLQNDCSVSSQPSITQPREGRPGTSSLALNHHQQSS